MKGLREIVLTHDLKKQGLNVSAIARKVGCDRKTVRKYINCGLEAPVYGPRQPQARVIEPYEHYLQEHVQTFPDLSGARLLREIREFCYDGGNGAQRLMALSTDAGENIREISRVCVGICRDGRAQCRGELTALSGIYWAR